MKVRKLLLGAFGLASLTACGGGGGGGTTTLTIEVLGNGTHQVAFQDSSGTWQNLTGGTSVAGKTTYTVNNVAGKYGVAVICEYTVGSITIKRGDIVQATVQELSNLKFTCPPAPFTISGSVTYSSSVNSHELYWRRTISNASNFSVSAYPGKYPLMAVEYDSSNNPIKVFKEYLTVNNNLTTNIDFSSNSNVQPADTTTANFTCSEPVAFGLYFWEGTQVYIYDYTPSVTNQTLTKLIPDIFVGNGGWLYVYDFSDGTGIEAVYKSFNNRNCKKPNAYTGSTSISTSPSGTAVFTWDSWNPGVPGHSLIGYSLWIILSSSQSWSIQLTNGWLGGCTTCSYTFPPSLPWNLTWVPNGVNHSSASITFYGFNGNFQEFMDCHFEGICPRDLELSWTREVF